MLSARVRTRAASPLGEAGRLRPGTAIPPPTGAFPRYVDPDEDAGPKAEPKAKKKNPKQQKS
jgi:methionyl-tRNA synthetase